MQVEDHPECHSHVQLEKPGGFLSQEYSGLSPLDFKENLKAQGWLSRLEQSGVLPPETDPQARESVLRQLYLGAVLAHLEPNLLVSPVLMFSAGDHES